VFNAAGLMVPEPSSMMPPAMPFIDADDAGCDVEYMMANEAQHCAVPSQLLKHERSVE
jgi:hypothetical protein